VLAFSPDSHYIAYNFVLRDGGDCPLQICGGDGVRLAVTKVITVEGGEYKSIEWAEGYPQGQVAWAHAFPDTTAPTSFATSWPLANSDGWNNSKVMVRMGARDVAFGSGVEKITYSASGAQTIAQTDASGSSVEVTLDQEGTTTLSYYATDKAGNVEAPKTKTVKIDKTPPTVNVAINGGDAYTNDTAVSLTLSDEPSPGSGVAQMSFWFDAGMAWSGWEPFATSKAWVVSDGDGEKTVRVRFKDRAGNQSDKGRATIVLDKTPPVVSSTSPSNNASGVSATAKVSATFFESGSGIDPSTLTVDTFRVVRLIPPGTLPVSGKLSYDEASQTVTFTPSHRLAKGTYRATISTGVKDNAGNALANTYKWRFATAGPSQG
jgi:hypothetical protein